MQPIAGPWLSPKVVTANSLPMVLPDMVVACGRAGVCLSLPAAARA
jgi:hypothetical protein